MANNFHFFRFGTAVPATITQYNNAVTIQYQAVVKDKATGKEKTVDVVKAYWSDGKIETVKADFQPASKPGAVTDRVKVTKNGQTISIKADDMAIFLANGYTAA